MKILIAGSSGQLGSCLNNSLIGHDLVPLDHNALDITQLPTVHEVLARDRPDLVINAAAFNDVDGAESRRNEAYAVNACGPRNLAFETGELGIPIVHVSTDYVFDGRLKRPYHEHDETNPLSLYAASKLAGERAVRLLNPRHYVVRTAWLFWESGKGFLTSMCSNCVAARAARCRRSNRIADLRASFGRRDCAPYRNRCVRNLSYGWERRCVTMAARD